jgi:LytS/YehU family sensor histidine kinase
MADLARMLGIAVAMGIAVGAIFSIGDGGIEPLALAINSAVATLYGITIGVPTMLAFRALRPRLSGTPELKQWLIYVGVLLGTTILGTLAARLVLALAGLITMQQMWEGELQAIEVSLAISIPCTLGAFTYSKLHGRIAASERETTEARLASLESRVRPHFLFNALNSAIALIPEDPQRAEDVLERLSALLRYSLEAHARLVPLGEELRVVEDYLEIERARFGDRLGFTIDVPAELRTLAVPAFAIQTLVENSVKYAVSPRATPTQIVVRARRDHQRLIVHVIDDGPGFGGDIWVPHHGLDSLRARLAALYGGAAQLVAPAPLDDPGAAVRFEVPA